MGCIGIKTIREPCFSIETSSQRMKVTTSLVCDTVPKYLFVTPTTLVWVTEYQSDIEVKSNTNWITE